MSDYETTPVEDADRRIIDVDDDVLDPEAPTGSTQMHPPREDADRTIPELDDTDESLQEENAGTSLDQPSDSSS